MRRRRPEDRGQLQLLESILAASIVFVAMAVVVLFRLPTNPGTFQESELERIAIDGLRVQRSKAPATTDDCNEWPCPFDNDLDRLLSLALGYVGPSTLNGSVQDPSGQNLDRGFAPNETELREVILQALPSGSHFLFTLSNGYSTTPVTPANTTPPASPTVVARLVTAPNWTIHRSNLTNATTLRINETTNFGALSWIYDPLNRTETQHGYNLTSLFSTRVPANATFGTYRACPGAWNTCRAFNVGPSFLIGAGSQILASDAGTTATLRSNGTFDARLKYNGSAVDVGVRAPLYVDMDDSGTVNAGDVRFSNVSACRGTAECRPGSYVRSSDGDLQRTLSTIPAPATLRLGSPDGWLDEGEPLYVDLNNDADVDVGDVRVTRFGLHPMGRGVAVGDADLGATLPETFTAARIKWADFDDDAALDEGEPVYLDLEGLGQTSALDVHDVHLTYAGEPLLRNPYDIRLVVWYGV